MMQETMNDIDGACNAAADKVRQACGSQSDTIVSNAYQNFPDTLKTNHRLGANGERMSNNGVYKLVMQEDGNLVVKEGEDVKWQTNTNTRGSHVTMQSDGNLVIYNANNEISDNSVFDTVTSTFGVERGPYELVMENDGNLVIYGALQSEDGEAKRKVWSTNGQPTGGKVEAVWSNTDNLSFDNLLSHPRDLTGLLSLQTHASSDLGLSNADIVDQSVRRIRNRALGGAPGEELLDVGVPLKMGGDELLELAGE